MHPFGCQGLLGALLEACPCSRPPPHSKPKLPANQIQPVNTLKNVRGPCFKNELCTKCNTLLGWGWGVLNRSGPAHLTFGYRFIIRHEIHSRLQLLVLFFFFVCLFMVFFQARGLSISSTYREKKKIN